MSYGHAATVDAPFASTLQRVRDELKAEGFGVLTETDVTATSREKLGAQMEDHVILGACNRRRQLAGDRIVLESASRAGCTTR